MRRIYKYTLADVDKQRIQIPMGFEFLSIQVQDGTAVMWCIVDPDYPKQDVTIFQVMTGDNFTLDQLMDRHLYLATVQIDTLVYHYFTYARS